MIHKIKSKEISINLFVKVSSPDGMKSKECVPLLIFRPVNVLQKALCQLCP